MIVSTQVNEVESVRWLSFCFTLFAKAINDFVVYKNLPSQTNWQFSREPILAILNLAILACDNKIMNIKSSIT
jgi:hypothetical protein